MTRDVGMTAGHSGLSRAAEEWKRQLGGEECFVLGMQSYVWVWSLGEAWASGFLVADEVN